MSVLINAVKDITQSIASNQLDPFQAAIAPPQGTKLMEKLSSSAKANLNKGSKKCYLVGEARDIYHGIA